MDDTKSPEPAGQDELEMKDLRYDDPAQDVESSRQPTLKKSVERRWMVAIYGLMFLAGWSDATTGPLLLRIQDNYSVSYPIVSLIFICAFIGFFSAAVVNIWLTHKIGYGRAIVFAASCQVVAFIIQSTKPPFPLFLISYIPNGLGMGLQDALGNAFITRLPGSSSKMSLAHAMYGFGAFVAPLVATQFAKEKMRGGWRFFYLVSLGVGLGNVACLAAVFRGKREERLFEEQGYRPVGDENDRMETPPMEIALRPTDQKPTGNSSSESNSQMKRIMSSPFIHLVAIFSWIYVGIEVTIGGWAVTFIIEARGGGDDSGYVSSGFFGGLMIGRVLQLAVGRWVSEHNIVFFYTAVALGLEIVIWQTTGVIGNAVCYAFIGLVLGPIYPIMMNATAAVIEPDLAGGAIGYIAALGQCGSAIFPWITGALAGRFGVWALQPLLVAMLVLEGALWGVVLWMSRGKWKRTHKI